MTAYERLCRTEALLWTLAHPGGQCCEGDLHEAAHRVFKVKMNVRRPGWDILDCEPCILCGVAHGLRPCSKE